ncbi:hypothetical protein A2U01_0089214, partial [Trifolium medium]|nr:hypothetical protein [Trifolium medium]
HFTASRRQPKTEAALEAIVQKEGETPRAYLDRFNKAAVEVKTEDRMKLFCSTVDFAEEVISPKRWVLRKSQHWTLSSKRLKN